MSIQLGQKVHYIRNREQFAELPDGQKAKTGTTITEGEGTVLAICLDSDKRRIVQLQEEGNHTPFNVDYACINPTLQFKEKYKFMIEQIQTLAKEGNDKARAIIAEYNARTTSLFNEVIGNPVEL